jgi:hypothetical protein
VPAPALVAGSAETSALRSSAQTAPSCAVTRGRGSLLADCAAAFAENAASDAMSEVAATVRSLHGEMSPARRASGKVRCGRVSEPWTNPAAWKVRAQPTNAVSTDGWAAWKIARFDRREQPRSSAA